MESGGRRPSQGPPVPYRERPLSYEPPVMCRCRLKAPRWISWSDDNPGRRYFRCSRAWHSEFMKRLLLDLRDAVWRIREERAELELCVNTELEVQKEMNQALQVENLKMQVELCEMKKKLAQKDEALQVMAMKISEGTRCRSISALLSVLVVGLAIGFMLGVIVA
ncbi:hypothetical protein BS78_10G072600 [Paspalum vaginatum]|nr:hypothetical protein BS78_10G072600 [Paspalum vaginatum]